MNNHINTTTANSSFISPLHQFKHQQQLVQHQLDGCNMMQNTHLNPIHASNDNLPIQFTLLQQNMDAAIFNNNIEYGSSQEASLTNKQDQVGYFELTNAIISNN